jgi:hypothetical protein
MKLQREGNGWELRDNVAPGYLGSRRDQLISELNLQYGTDGWKFVWCYDTGLLDFVQACKVYEEAYYKYFQLWPGLLDYVCRKASDVYDDAVSNVGSGLDYMAQETGHTHIQDIAIRNCVERVGKEFLGKEPMQIRERIGKDAASTALSPGQVPFHEPGLITTPTNIGEFIDRWWLPGSVEDFYQRNRRIFVKK